MRCTCMITNDNNFLLGSVIFSTGCKSKHKNCFIVSGLVDRFVGFIVIEDNSCQWNHYREQCCQMITCTLGCTVSARAHITAVFSAYTNDRDFSIWLLIFCVCFFFLFTGKCSHKWNSVCPVLMQRRNTFYC